MLLLRAVAEPRTPTALRNSTLESNSTPQPLEGFYTTLHLHARAARTQILPCDLLPEFPSKGRVYLGRRRAARLPRAEV